MVTAKVFISHASQDGAFADALCRRLEDAGIACWMAPRDVEPGQDFDVQIHRAVVACGALVVLVSAASNDSRFVKSEVELAFSSRKPIFPVRLEEVALADGLQLYLRTSHWTDAFGPGREATLARLEGSLRRLDPAAKKRQAEVPAAVARDGAAATDGHAGGAMGGTDPELLRRFVGDSADYYLQRWKRMERSETSTSFNLAGAILGPVWAAWRKLYPVAWAGCLAALLILFLATALGGTARMVLALVLAAAGWVGVFGLFGNALYRGKALREVAAIAGSPQPREERLAEAGQRGGVSALAAVLWGILFGFACLVTAAAGSVFGSGGQAATGVSPDAVHAASAAASPQGAAGSGGQAAGAAAPANPAWLGVFYGSVDAQIAEAAGLASARGAYVVHVESRSPAERAGLEAGDILLGVNRWTIQTQSDVPQAIGELPVGQEATLAVHRRGSPIAVRIVPVARPPGQADNSDFFEETPDRVATQQGPLDPVDFRIARWTSLPFYPDARMWEFGRLGSAALVSYLIPAKGKPVHLDGTSAPIHAYNKTALDLSSPGAVRAYLHFFCASIWSEAGAFRIIEAGADLPAGATQEMRNAIVPISVVRTDDGYRATATVLYGTHLFTANFTVAASGQVDILDDVPGPGGEILNHVEYRDGQRQPRSVQGLEAKYWPLPPPIPGDWQNATHDDLVRARQLILAMRR